VWSLRAEFPGLVVIGPAQEADRITGLDVKVGEGDRVALGASSARVIETPGHTAGHIVYHFEADGVAFCGDTLFSLGCGRVFETPHAVMWASLLKLAALPAETAIYCGHEYTQSNARFALSVDPDNGDLQRRAAEVAAMREKGLPTVPTRLSLELATNPFLRAERPDMQARLGLSGAGGAAAFAELRTRKDKF
jgi:hydroxyacylglutathione hydrolase